MSRIFKLVLAVFPVLLVVFLWRTGQTDEMQTGMRLAAEIADWQLIDSKWFSEHLMHEKINGKAQVYHRFGVIGLFAGTWTKGDQSWDMYLYQMKDGQAAKGIYLLERPDTFLPVAGSDTAYHAGSSHTSRFGSYYLQLLSLTSGSAAAGVDSLAAGISAALASGAIDTAGPTVELPAEFRVAGSEGLINKDAFGYKSLPDVHHAIYDVADSRAMWFTAAGGPDALSAYKAELEKFGGEDIFELDGAVGANMFDSWELAAVVNGTVIGVRDAESKEELLKHWKILKEAMAN